MESKCGLGGAVMSMDVTPVVLSQKPGIDGEVYWTRKAVSLRTESSIVL
jgi:hypothetical protein